MFRNELKVGLAIALAFVVFFVGSRFMTGLPIFGGNYPLHTQMESANGLTVGSGVTINGVKVGTVDRVQLDTRENTVHVGLQIQGDVDVPEGTRASVSGFSYLGSVEVKLLVGQGPGMVEPGSFIPSLPGGGALDRMTERAPELMERADTLLTTVNSTFAATDRLLATTDGDIRATLSGLRSSSQAVSRLVREQEAQLRETLRNLNAVSNDISHLTGTQRDTIEVAIERLNRTLVTTSRATATLDRLLTRIERGDGTIGRLMNDTTLYVRLDTTSTRLNRLLLDFEQNPGRYLREMRIVDFF